MSLTSPKKIVKMDGPNIIGPLLVKGSSKIYHGALVALNGGYAKMAAGNDDIVIGVANLQVWDDTSNDQGLSFAAANLPGTSGAVIDNSNGNDGDRQVTVEMGVFKFLGKSGDAPAQTDIGGPCYVEDEQTVKMTAGGAIAVGTVIRIDDDGNPFVQVPAGAFGNI
jgi:hypothetical protein